MVVSRMRPLPAHVNARGPNLVPTLAHPRSPPKPLHSSLPLARCLAVCVPAGSKYQLMIPPSNKNPRQHAMTLDFIYERAFALLAVVIRVRSPAYGMQSGGPGGRMGGGDFFLIRPQSPGYDPGADPCMAEVQAKRTSRSAIHGGTVAVCCEVRERYRY